MNEQKRIFALKKNHHDIFREREGQAVTTARVTQFFPFLIHLIVSWLLLLMNKFIMGCTDHRLLATWLLPSLRKEESF